MKFLLTNDDGIDAPGLAALERAVAPLGDCLVVAPDRHLSGCSHQATTHRPLELKPVSENRHALDGTPVDCTRVAMLNLGWDCDWVISGVNAGGNLGADLYLSGTIAAAREGALFHKRGIAISQYFRRGLPMDWENVARWTESIVRILIARYNEPGVLWNVNLPHLPPGSEQPEAVFCELDPHPLPVDFGSVDGKLQYQGAYQDRRNEPGRDIAVCFSGRIAITHLLLG